MKDVSSFLGCPHGERNQHGWAPGVSTEAPDPGTMSPTRPPRI